MTAEDDPVLQRMLDDVRADMPSIGNSVKLILTFGAALRDATPEQRARLKRQADPLIKRMRVDGKAGPLYRLFAEVLGKDWRPTGESAAWIEALDR